MTVMMKLAAKATFINIPDTHRRCWNLAARCRCATAHYWYNRRMPSRADRKEAVVISERGRGPVGVVVVGAVYGAGVVGGVAADVAAVAAALGAVAAAAAAAAAQAELASGPPKVAMLEQTEANIKNRAKEERRKQRRKRRKQKRRVVKIGIQLYSVPRTGLYCLDIQMISGDMFVFLDLCGRLVTAV